MKDLQTKSLSIDKTILQCFTIIKDYYRTFSYKNQREYLTMWRSQKNKYMVIIFFVANN